MQNQELKVHKIQKAREIFEENRMNQTINYKTKPIEVKYEEMPALDKNTPRKPKK